TCYDKELCSNLQLFAPQYHRLYTCSLNEVRTRTLTMDYKLASTETAETCSLCDGNSIVCDSETSEAVCSSCGMVIHDNVESMGPEWRTYSSEDLESRSRTGMPSSLAFHDMGLSTFISYSNVDANGVAISAEQRSKVQRMRRWNKISSNNRSYHRNLKNAF